MLGTIAPSNGGEVGKGGYVLVGRGFLGGV